MRRSRSRTDGVGDDPLPVRDPSRRRSSSCTTALLPCLAPGGAPLVSEGRLDLDFQIIMSVAPHVREYREQPETFRWTDGGRVRRYTPDGLIGSVIGRLYVEIKPAAKLAKSPDLDGKLDGIRAECDARRAGFAILTEREIRGGRLLANSLRIWSAASDADPGEVLAACAALRSLPTPTTLGEVWRRLGPGGRRLADALLGLRVLAVDLNGTMDASTPVARGAKDWS